MNQRACIYIPLRGWKDMREEGTSVCGLMRGKVRLKAIERNRRYRERGLLGSNTEWDGRPFREGRVPSG